MNSPGDENIVANRKASPAAGVQAKSGELGSGADYLESLVVELRASDSSKAAALEADLQELKAASGSAQVKSKAKAMADKL